MVLERDDLLDDGPGVATQRLADELQRVAQPLRRDPQVVERGHVGPAQDGLVRADALVGRPDPRGHRVPDPVRLGRAYRQDALTLGLDEQEIALHPAPVAVGVELAEEDRPRRLAPGAPALDQAVEGRALRGGLRVAVGLAGLDQHVEVPHRAEVGCDLAQAAAVLGGPLGVERLAEHAPRGPLAAGGHPHRVQLLAVPARPGAGLAGDHAGEVEAQDLAPRLGEVIVGQDARRLGDDDPGRLGLLLGGGTFDRSLGRDRRDPGTHRHGLPGGPRLRLRPPHGLQRPLQLGGLGREQLLDLGQQVRQRLQRRLGALAQLHLQLREPLQDASPGHDLHVVHGQLGHGPVVLVVALAPRLPHGHEVLERHVTDQLQHPAPRRRRRPAGRRHGRVRGALELLAAVDAAPVIDPAQPLERDHRPVARRPQPPRIPRRRQPPVGRVEITVLVEHRGHRPARGEPGEVVRREEALARACLRHPELELHLDRRDLGRRCRPGL